MESAERLQNSGWFDLVGASLRRAVARSANYDWLIVGGLILAALCVRGWEIRTPLQGDEYSSLQEAAKLGNNLSGLLYFTLLHFWMRLGDSDWWYRLLSILLGVAALPFAYWAGRLTGSRLTGFVFATLVAISPFAVQTSHSIRHYSLALTASIVALTATLYLLSYPERRWSWLFMGTSLLMLTLSHIFGILLSSILLLLVYGVRGRWPRKQSHRFILIGIGLAIVSTTLLWPVTRYHGWQFLQRSIDAFQRSNYELSRGLSIVQLIKIPFTFFIFSLGYGVYPLLWFVVLPAALLVVTCTILGAIMLWRHRALPVILSVLSLILIVFLVLDSLTPPNTEMASAHHVTIAWPGFALLLAAGAARYRRGILVLPLLLVMVVGPAVAGWDDDWTIGGLKSDWRTAAKFAMDSKGERTAVVYDGRSQSLVARYFPEELQQISNGPYLQRDDIGNLVNYNRLIFLTNDFHAEPRQRFNRLLDELNESFTWVDGRVTYPFFEYVLERRAARMSGYDVVPQTGQIRQPLSIYSVEFQDLHLPVSIDVEGVPLIIMGSFGLNNEDGQRERSVRLATTQKTDRLILLSNVTASQKLTRGQQLGQVVLESTSGEVLTFPLRLGAETESWDQTCSSNSGCLTEYRWHKRVAFTGQQAYPGAWRDFQAGLHSTVITLPHDVEISSLTLRYLADAGRLNIWGLAVPAQQILSRVEKHQE